MKSIKHFFMLSALAVGCMVHQANAKSVQAQDEAQEAVGELKMISVIPYNFKDGQLQILLLKESDNKYHTVGIARKENQKQDNLKGVLLQWIGEKYSVDAKSMEREHNIERNFLTDEGATINYLVRTKYVDVKAPEAQWLSYAQLVAQSQAGHLAEDALAVYNNQQFQDILNSYKPAKPAKKSRRKK